MPDSHRPFDGQPPIADPAPHLRARVPDQVAGGSFSTGAIVVTGPTEFIIDFLQTISRPHRVTSRVILPHPVMPQFIEALGKNLAIFTDRFGPPVVPLGVSGPASAVGITAQPQILSKLPETTNSGATADNDPTAAPTPPANPGALNPGAPSPLPPGQSPPPAPADSLQSAFGSTDVFPGSPVADPGAPAGNSGAAGSGTSGDQHRRPTPQEIYDDLKIADAILSGAYANGVMIGHGSSEFCLDFLTSFYPQSAVSARVFMAAPQIPRLLESLQHAYRQLGQFRQPPRPPRGDDPAPPHSDPGN